jgi:hypothetical protein
MLFFLILLPNDTHFPPRQAQAQPKPTARPAAPRALSGLARWVICVSQVANGLGRSGQLGRVWARYLNYRRNKELRVFPGGFAGLCGCVCTQGVCTQGISVLGSLEINTRQKTIVAISISFLSVSFKASGRATWTWLRCAFSACLCCRGASVPAAILYPITQGFPRKRLHHYHA